MSRLEQRIPPPLVAIVLAVVAWQLAAWLPAWRVTSVAQTLLAVIIAMAGIAIDIAAVLTFRRVRTTVNPLRPHAATELVTHGPNAISRNPMYVGLALILTAVVVYLGSLPAVLVVPIFVLYLTRFQIVPEERALGRLFGESYERYCRNVRRWL